MYNQKMLISSLHKIRHSKNLTDVVKSSLRYKFDYDVDKITERDMVTFKEWHDNMAYIPKTDENGDWYDTITGVYFSDFDKENRKNFFRQPQSDEVLKMRKYARRFGGRALLGTRNQVTLAEEIRYKKLMALENQEDKQIICDPTCVLRHSFVWIANKKRKSEEFVEFVKKTKEILDKHFDAQQLGDEKKIREIAIEYNKITSDFGIK